MVNNRVSQQGHIALSFFPLVESEFDFRVYRKLYKDEKQDDYSDCIRKKLPSSSLNGANISYVEYWVAFDYKEDFEEFVCNSYTNHTLTTTYLFHVLKRIFGSRFSPKDVEVLERFRRTVQFTLQRYPEGNQIVWLEPYYLKTTKQFGMLADFAFEAPHGMKVTPRILQLSLSLDRSGKSNRNFYVDRYEKLQCFLAKYFDKLSPLTEDTHGIKLSRNLVQLECESLQPKIYEFANGKQGKSQFVGVKSYGPLVPVEDNTKVYFIYQESDKTYSYDLFKALRGDTFPTSFPGMEKMFQYRFTNENIGGVALEDFSPESIEKTLSTIFEDAAGKPVVPVLIVPFHKLSDDSAAYYKAKHTFLKRQVPSQFVSLKLLRAPAQLKWSVANIGLQLFAKMGGYPWKVVPKISRALIIGLGQAHHRDEQGRIDKYFAYTILTESSGLYKELKVLSQSPDTGTYINNFKKNLQAVFTEHIDQYDSFIIHTTFSIRNAEIDAVRSVLDSLSTRIGKSKEFVVMKFNDTNKFFAYSTANNSMVPYESSVLRLSRNEYLVWFEGLQYHTPNVRQKIQRPMHIEFVYPKDGLTDERMRFHLQDALNISGANWRGFNAKSLPISAYYAHLVAEYYKEFQVLGLEDINFEKVRPWFL